MIVNIIIALLIQSSMFVGTIAYAQPATVVIQLDKATYSTGDKIYLTGKVQPVVANEKILIRVYNSAGALSRIEPLSVNADGSYAYNYTIGGPLNRQSGEYKVFVTYLGIIGQTAFSFTAEEEWKSYPATFGGRQYEIRYMISVGSVTSINGSVDLATLTVALLSNSNGELTIRIPNGILPVRVEPEVFVDTIPANSVRHMATDCYSEITVPFVAGTEELEVVGGYPFYTEEPALTPVNIPYSSNLKFHGEGEQFDLAAKLTASDCSFSFLQNERRIHANVTGPNEGSGYFELTIPHRFLGGSYTVLLDREPLQNFTTSYNPAMDGEDSTNISFTYDPTAVDSIDIIGTTAIPEFEVVVLVLILSLLLPVAARLRYQVS